MSVAIGSSAANPGVAEHRQLSWLDSALTRTYPAGAHKATVISTAATVTLMLNPLRAMGVVHGAGQMATASVLGLAALWLVLLNDVYRASTSRGGPMGALVDGAFVRDVA